MVFDVEDENGAFIFASTADKLVESQPSKSLMNARMLIKTFFKSPFVAVADVAAVESNNVVI